MVIIVIGAGKVGFRVARQLVQESHDVVLVDIDGQNLEPAREVLDVMTIHGNGAGPKAVSYTHLLHILRPMSEDRILG